MLDDRRYRWIIVVYSLVIQAVSVGILVYCFTLFTLPWLEHFAASRRDVMITIAGLQIGMGVLAPIIGPAMDRFPMRNLVISGAVLLGLGLWCVQQATALWQIWLVYATLMPLSTVLMGSLASQTLVAKWFQSERGLALGVSAMGTNLGGMVFPLLVAGWLESLGWRDTFFYLAVTTVVIVVPLTLLILSREPQPQEQTSGVKVSAANLRLWTTREILASRMFWLPFICLLPLNMSFGALQFNLAIFADDLGLSKSIGAQLIAVSAMGMVTGKLVCGLLGDRIDHRWLFWLACSIMMSALGLMLWATNYVGLLLAVVCLGLAGGGILPMMGVIFGDRFGAASFGRVMGFAMVNVLFGALAPVFSGWVYDATGQYDIAFWAIAALFPPVMLAMFWLPEPPR